MGVGVIIVGEDEAVVPDGLTITGAALQPINGTLARTTVNKIILQNVLVL